MSRYFKIFKVNKQNIVRGEIYSSNIQYINHLEVSIKDLKCTAYELYKGNLFVGSGLYRGSTDPYIHFYRSNYNFRNLEESYCSIVIQNPSKTEKLIMLEELYNELGNLKDPEEIQISCYTNLINRLTNG